MNPLTLALTVISLLTREVNATRNKRRNVRVCDTGEAWEQDGTNGGGISGGSLCAWCVVPLPTNVHTLAN